MNLNSLTTPIMLNLTERWVSDSSFRSGLASAGPLGVGVLAELDNAHAPLAEVQSNRTDNRGHIRHLIDRAAELDILHDRKARALFYCLRALIEMADDDVTVVEHRALLDLLFPNGLSVTKLPYIEEGGSAVALERAVKPEIRAKLAAITVGPRSLEQLFDAWMAAARELAQVVKQRAELVAQTRRDGSGGQAFDLKTGRNQWIRAVRGLLWALDVKPELATMREAVLAVLTRAVATAARRGASGQELLEGDVDDGDAALEDEDVEDVEDVEGVEDGEDVEGVDVDEPQPTVQDGDGGSQLGV